MIRSKDSMAGRELVQTDLRPLDLKVRTLLTREQWNGNNPGVKDFDYLKTRVSRTFVVF